MKRLKEIIRVAGYFVLGGIIIMGLIAVFSPDDEEDILDLDNLNVAQVSEEKIINVVEYGTLYQLQGSLNGTVGRFEWIIQNQQVTHRMFVPGGGINGIPIMP